MTAEDFEDDVALAIDNVLAGISKDDVVASLEHLIKQVRSGTFDPSIPPNGGD